MIEDNENLPPEPEDINLLNVLADLGGQDDVKVNIYRTGAKYHGQLVFITSVRPEQFSPEMLRDTYRGGEFRIHVRSNGKLIANRGMSVEEQPDQNEFGKLAELLTQQNSGRNESSGMERLVEAMSAGFSQLGQLIVSTQNNQPQLSQAESMQQTLVMMESMKNIMDNGSNKVDQTTMLLKGIELARELVPKEGESNGMDVLLESLKTFGKPIAEMSSQMFQQNPGGFNQPVIAGMPQRKPIQQNPQQLPPQNEETMRNAFIKHQVNMLLKQAKRNSDPGLYADLILDQLPEEQIQMFLGSPEWFNEVVKINPESAQFQPWFEQLKNFVIAGLTDEPEGDNLYSEGQTVIIPGAVAGMAESENLNEAGGEFTSNS